MPKSRVVRLFVLFLGIGVGVAIWATCWKAVESVSNEAPSAKREFPIPPYSKSKYLNAQSDAKFIGSTACASCHPNNHRSYLLTPHSRALAEVDPNAEPPDGSFDHKASGRTYRIFRKDGQLHHEEVLCTERGKEIAKVDQPVKYRVGSGHFCRSYIAEVDGFLHESPITWYTPKQKWDMSPGYDFPQHWGFERPVRLGCVSCHAGRVEVVDGTVHRLKMHEMAIGCENCHGPGAIHQELHSSGKAPHSESDLTIVHPAKLSRSLQESICASCHESEAATVLIRGRKQNDFRPGQPLSDYRVHFRFAGSGGQMTVVGHMEQLRQSACYQKSPELTCITCHDPHHTQELKDKTSYYREKCLSCHESRPCKVELNERQRRERDNCVACHMPRGDTDIPHIAFTHHRIGKHLGQPIPLTDVPDLVAVEDAHQLEPIERRRNFGLAYVELLRNAVYAKFADVFLERARENLEAGYDAGLHDGEIAAALAEIYWKTNDLSLARKFAQEALDSGDAFPSSQALVLLILADYDRQNQDMSLAIEHLKEAVRLCRSSDNWRLLGVSYLDSKQPDQALPALKEALAIRPYRHTTHLGLAETYRRLGDLPHTNQHLEIARWLLQHNQD